MELSKRERNEIYLLLVSAYPSSCIMGDDDLVVALRELSNRVERQAAGTRLLLRGVDRERRICAGCGEPYGAVRKNQKYCHTRCSARIYQRTYRERHKGE